MKRLIASDIHGSARFCRQLLKLYDAIGAEQLVLLGDIAYSGSYASAYEYDPAGVIAQLNPLADDILCVEGNCDFDLAALSPRFSLLPQYTLVRWDGWDGFLTHGHRLSPHNPPPRGMADFLLSGHTHIPAARQVGDLLCLNPGSVSLPRGRSSHSCMLYENGTFRWLTLDGEEFGHRTLA